MINNSKYLFNNVYVSKIIYVWLTYMCFVYMVFHNKADSVEATCLLASIKGFILYTFATENYQRMHAVYLAAS